MKRAALSLAIVACGACGGDGEDGPPPLFPRTYAADYAEVRACRFSLEHDMRRIRVLASPDAATPYNARTAFPVGAIILKVEYENADTTCSGAPIGFTVMQKLADGADPTLIDWTWQETDGDERVLDVNPVGCASCHKNCEGGFAGTCTPP